MEKLRIFLADDHMVVREGLKAMINASFRLGETTQLRRRVQLRDWVTRSGSNVRLLVS